MGVGGGIGFRFTVCWCKGSRNSAANPTDQAHTQVGLQLTKRRRNAPSGHRLHTVRSDQALTGSPSGCSSRPRLPRAGAAAAAARGLLPQCTPRPMPAAWPRLRPLWAGALRSLPRRAYLSMLLLLRCQPPLHLSAMLAVGSVAALLLPATQWPTSGAAVVGQRLGARRSRCTRPRVVPASRRCLVLPYCKMSESRVARLCRCSADGRQASTSLN